MNEPTMTRQPDDVLVVDGSSRITKLAPQPKLLPAGEMENIQIALRNWCTDGLELHHRLMMLADGLKLHIEATQRSLG